MAAQVALVAVHAARREQAEHVHGAAARLRRARRPPASAGLRDELAVSIAWSMRV